MKKKLIALGTVMAFGTLLGVGLAKHGADDGPGHVRGGNDDPPGHTRAAPKANSGFSVLERRGADDPQPHGRRPPGRGVVHAQMYRNHERISTG